MQQLPHALFVLRCMVRDTVRQALAARVFWLGLLLSGGVILLCASVRMEGAAATMPKGEIELFSAQGQVFTGTNPGRSAVSVGFGAFHLTMFRDARAMTEFLQVLLARWGAGAVGLLLLIVWTSGFLPDFLRPEAATVLLTKPVPRWALLAGKFTGVLLLALAQVSFFVLGTWLALGFATDQWPAGYLFTIPVVTLQFAVLYSVSALLAVL